MKHTCRKVVKASPEAIAPITLALFVKGKVVGVALATKAGVHTLLQRGLGGDGRLVLIGHRM